MSEDMDIKDFSAEDFNLDDIDDVSLNLNRILVATDGSHSSIMAVEYAVALAKITRAAIKAVYVDTAEDDWPYPEVPFTRDFLKEISPSAAGLNVAKLFAEKNGVKCETALLYHTNAAEAIVEAANKYDADLIIVGNTDRGGLRRLAIGSVAETVANTSNIPVLVLK